MVFTQRKYLFLVDYIVEFLGSLHSDCVRVREYDGGTIDVNIRKCGMDALLGAGIGRYSWKVAQWLRKVAEARSERSKYYTTGQVAKLLNLSRQTVYRMVKAGKVSYVRGSMSRRRHLSLHYIPVNEVERLKSKLCRADDC